MKKLLMILVLSMVSTCALAKDAEPFSQYSFDKYQFRTDKLGFSEGLLLVHAKINGEFKTGFIDKTGNLAIQAKFDDCEPDASCNSFHEGLAAARYDGKWGYIDKFGNWVIQPQFNDDEYGFFSEGLTPVRVDKKWGFLNKTGNLIISPQFQNVYGFREGLAPARSAGKWGYIDKVGNWVIQPRFDDAMNFFDGLALVKVDRLLQVIDKTGNVVFKTESYEATNFSEGLASFKVNTLWGIVDKTGNWVIKPKFNQSVIFHEGLAQITFDCVFIEREGNKCNSGFINKIGQILIQSNELIFSDFSEGLAIARQRNGKIGYIDKAGNWMIQPKFDYAQDFHEGLAKVKVNELGWGFVDKTGKFVILETDLNKLQPYRDKFLFAKTSSEFESFVNQYKNNDPENLVPKAEAQAKTLAVIEAKQAKEQAAADAKLAKEQAAAEAKQAKEQAAAEAKERQQLAAFRKKLQDGDETNCGAVIESKPKMVKIAFAIANYGNEHWIRREEIFPAGYGCRFVNGQYQPPM